MRMAMSVCAAGVVLAASLAGAAGVPRHRDLSARGVCRPARQGDGADRRRRGDRARHDRAARRDAVPAEQPVLLSHRRRRAARERDHRRPHEDDDGVPAAGERRGGTPACSGRRWRPGADGGEGARRRRRSLPRAEFTAAITALADDRRDDLHAVCRGGAGQPVAGRSDADVDREQARIRGTGATRAKRRSSRS